MRTPSWRSWGKPGSLEFQLSDGTVVLDGSNVTSAEARVTQDSMRNNQYVVALTFDDEGTTAFAEATKDNIGNQIMIVYDGEGDQRPGGAE